MVIGYSLLELALVVLAVPILVAEALLLVSLAFPARLDLLDSSSRPDAVGIGSRAPDRV